MRNYIQNLILLMQYKKVQTVTQVFVSSKQFSKIPCFGRQEPQHAGTTKWTTTLRFGEILGTTSVVRSILFQLIYHENFVKIHAFV